MKRLTILTAAVCAAVGVLVGLTLPPRRLLLSPVPDGTIAGALHIHTDRSDGRSGAAEIAAAAARSGLKFIVLTDHGDATRASDPPAYYSGVLRLDGVEISTEGGHLVVLDMPASPEAIWGAADTVAEQVRRLGGFAIVAHPDSPKAALRWQGWDIPFDGVEWVNPDTSWRIRAQAGWLQRFGLLAALLHYPFRPAETIAGLLTGSDETLAYWTAAASSRRVVGIAGVDAHAKLALRNSDPGDNRWSLPLPSYEALFRTLSVHVAPEQPLSGNAAADARLVTRAIRAGHLYTAIDGIASPPSFTFTATNARGTAYQGDELGVGGPVSLHVRSNAPAGFTTTVWRNSEVLKSDRSGDFTVVAPEAPAIYRVEIRAAAANSGQTWLLSNPIYVRERK